jgi:hypothetical protein
MADSKPGDCQRHSEHCDSGAEQLEGLGETERTGCQPGGDRW